MRTGICGRAGSGFSPTPSTRAGRRGGEASGTPLCDAIQPGAAYPFPVIRAAFSGPAPRPHALTLSGVETPVNLAFVEAPSAQESPMEFSKRVLIVDNEPSVDGVLLEFFARFQHGHAYDVVPPYSA